MITHKKCCSKITFQLKMNKDMNNHLIDSLSFDIFVNA